MEKISAGKFQFEPPFTSLDHLVGDSTSLCLKLCKRHDLEHDLPNGCAPIRHGDSEVNFNFLANNRLPGLFQYRENVVAGGLMSYGVSLPDLFRRAAGYVDKILRGTRPVDLPVEQLTKFELVVSLRTAKALGLAIPEPFLPLGDEIIE